MKYLVLGSSGVVGRALVEYLTLQNHEVLEFDIANGIEQDLLVFNNALLSKLMSQADFVFFLAWDVGGSVYLSKYQNTYEFIDNNLRIIINSFEMLKYYKKPFIFTSSQMSNMTHSSYGLTKAIGEKLTDILGGITVKFWNVYGFETDLTKSHVITDFILKARDWHVIDMMTDGTEQRQMLYSSDCVECLYELSKHYTELPRDREYHITSFEWTSIREIAETIAEYYGDISIIPSSDKDVGQKDKRNEPDKFILNYWAPKVSIKEGILKVIKRLDNAKNY